jgi:hypothetical protein
MASGCSRGCRIALPTRTAGTTRRDATAACAAGRSQASPRTTCGAARAAGRRPETAGSRDVSPRSRCGWHVGGNGTPPVDAAEDPAETHVGCELVELAAHRELARVGAGVGYQCAAVVAGDERVGQHEALVEEPLEHGDGRTRGGRVARRVRRVLRNPKVMNPASDLGGDGLGLRVEEIAGQQTVPCGRDRTAGGHPFFGRSWPLRWSFSRIASTTNCWIVVSASMQ